MRIAISQPAYLPWAGYFDLIDQVETFVLLDSVQFEKQSWQHRNRIKTPTGLQWLTVPVIFRGHFGQLIHEVRIRDREFRKNHLRAIELNYRRAPFFERYFSELKQVLPSDCVSLIELNQTLIEWFCQVLSVKTRLIRSSEIGGKGKRSELLVNLCQILGANFYLSPLGSAVYLMNDLNFFSDAGIGVAFQHYEHPQYRQLFSGFESHASVLDLIFNEGPASGPIMRSGRRPPFAPAEVACAAVSGGHK